MNVLIVEDDSEVAEFVARGLEEAGLDTAIAHTGEAGLQQIADGGYAAAVIDIQLPGISGLELIRIIRRESIRIPIIILSAHRQTADKICGLNIGADDYLSKPFALNELVARVNALLRRSSIECGRRLIVRDLVVDTAQRLAYRGEQAVNLTAREYELLEYLARNAGRPVTARAIMQNAWKCADIPIGTIVAARLCGLRKKLCPNGEDEIIHTVRGFGYVLR